MKLQKGLVFGDFLHFFKKLQFDEKVCAMQKKQLSALGDHCV